MVIFLNDFYYIYYNRLYEGTDKAQKKTHKKKFNRKVCVCSHVVIGALRGVGTDDF